jgi:hypothetical protein
MNPEPSSEKLRALEQEIRSARLKYEQAKERESEAWRTWIRLQIESEEAKQIVEALQKQYAKMKYTDSEPDDDQSSCSSDSSEEEEDEMEDCDNCGYTHHYEDKCPVGKQCEKFTRWWSDDESKH